MRRHADLVPLDAACFVADSSTKTCDDVFSQAYLFHVFEKRAVLLD